MAGMLAGVESARRRRIHQNIVCSSSSSSPSPSTGGASLCLRRSLFFPTSPSLLGMSRRRIQGEGDEKLGQLARQAKERLDERLRAPLPPTPRNSTCEGRVESRSRKKKKKGWGASAMARLGGMKSEDSRGDYSECVICLEQLRTSSSSEVVNLECSHTFHMQCIITWLHSHSICPCCRTPTSFSFSSSSSSS